VVLTLSDDGIGMERERLDALMTGLQGERPPEGWGSGGIGLRNVNERLKLHYDRGYEMAISSRPGEGTVITLRLPLSGGIGKEGDEA
jgi:two-component system sensor histidine kinase YesM